ncbi:uncharacterized protein LOC117645492 [Thrips palmi]|uniref:Uncharacterized protein LOC117645492 n=1 Tax=Thrips palmi TaxID=161013 RepID=A0A6P8Z4V9_THRPL|nr:uncharacterized protein LOC117645492 [Thrips palmi]
MNAPVQKTRSMSTQTEVPRKRDVNIQVCIEEAMVSHKKCHKSRKFEFFTGLNAADFEALYQFFGGNDCFLRLKLNYRIDTPKKLQQSRIGGRDRLMMFLLRLRRGLPLEELSFIFGISPSYAGELCYVVTRVVFLTFKTLEEKIFISAARQAQSKPRIMKPFKNLRVIVDGAYFLVQTPSNFHQQGNTFSKYKESNAIEHIIGVSCHGSVIFCSPGFEANMSEKEAVLNSNLLQMLSEGDSVMSDRGFELVEELQMIGVHLYKPPNKCGDLSLTAEQEILTKQIASARIYSEHAIADIKDCRLLQSKGVLTMLPVWPQLVFISAMLTNCKESRIKDKNVAVEECDSSTQ